ncbi:MAG: hypothetical protein ABI333_23575 [bacterium]
MSEREIRKILNEVCEDLDAGRVRQRWLRFGRLGTLGPVLLAVGMSAGALGCHAQSIGTEQDASQQRDAAIERDAFIQRDAAVYYDDGAVVTYGIPDVDAEIDLDADLDAEIDAEGTAIYSAPPIDPDEDE